ncbi:hypothetical protein CKM354_000381800 [Cercospora kikuchii]|uniref:FAD-binding domain-containing protein n=1 Tax=Cercospora kikuchii TaxID=84275 RepID=A0A9P3CL59_9PEZI|nr:uncharacterized protein CKM354_000381800 [Cercospora kikuchii]GIZ40483.1 hypothetical protein CKM354_000381800 [Cercospora kikuchii]
MGLSILIVGGGLGGLAAAAYLRRNHNVTILERNHLDFTKNDYGISVIANAYNLLQKAGIDDSKLDMAVMTRVWIRNYKNQEIFTEDFDTRQTFGAPSVLTKRSHLHKELHRLATSPDLTGKPAQVIEGVRVVEVDTSNGTVHSADGNAYTADFIIGADGINSVVRSAVVSKSGESKLEAEARNHDLLAYMAQVPISAVEATPELAYFAASGHFGLTSWSSPNGRSDKRRMLAYHINSREVQFVGYAREEEFAAQFEEKKTTIIKGVPATRVQAAFSDYPPAVTKIFSHHHSGDGTVEAWRIRDIDPQDTWHRGRALLIGDAAHAVTPHAGQGCNSAFEDAEALGFLLKDAETFEDVEAIIPKFLQIRKARAQDIAWSSRHMGGLLSPKDQAAAGEFDQVEFGKRNYGYRGAEDALKAAAAS